MRAAASSVARRVAQLIALCSLACASSAHATTYDVAVLLEGQWRVEASSTRCLLSRDVAGVGSARFERSAASAEQFRFVLRDRLPDGPVQATVAAPPWHPRFPSDAHLKTIEHPADGRTLVLAALPANSLRVALAAGMAGVFTADATPAAGLPVPASGFAEPHARYARCLARLPPPVDAVRTVARARASAPTRRAPLRARVQFAVEQAQLDARGKRALAALLARGGDGVRRIVVSGFSDDGGDFANNVRLSRLRAREVVEYLRAVGVPASRIGMRYFGDQYPIADSLTAEGRAANRRATIELVAR